MADHAAPVFSPLTRTRIYVGSLAVNVLTLLVAGVLLALEVVDPIKTAGVVVAILGAVGLLCSGTGTSYRPTRNVPLIGD